MSMTQNMVRVERMALRGLSVDQILAAGIPLPPRTVASIVDLAQAAVEAEREAKEAAEAERAAEVSRRRAAAVASYRVIEVRLDGVRNSIASIIRATAAKHGLTTTDLVGRSRALHTVIPARQEAMYLCANDTPYGMPEIGKAFDRDHTTVLHGIRKHCERNGLPLPRGMQPEGAANGANS
jgi:chromosomal replication initiator protein